MGFLCVSVYVLLILHFVLVFPLFFVCFVLFWFVCLLFAWLFSKERKKCGVGWGGYGEDLGGDKEWETMIRIWEYGKNPFSMKTNNQTRSQRPSLEYELSRACPITPSVTTSVA